MLCLAVPLLSCMRRVVTQLGSNCFTVSHMFGLSVKSAFEVATILCVGAGVVS